MQKQYNYDIRELQIHSVCLLEEVERVCREHNLTYYVIAGTLLGAERHKGFIPWDDDIDIALLRKDYDVLIEHADEWLSERFHIVTHDNDSAYPKYFAKIEDTSTTLVENINLGYVGGLYADIFPLDDVPDNKITRAIHFCKFKAYRKLLYFAYRNPYKHGKGLRSVIPLLVRNLFSRKKLHAWTQGTLKEYNGHSNCNYVMTHDDGFKAYDKSIFAVPKSLIFEGIEVPGPTNPDGFLSVIYGDDYMQLPSQDKRVSHFHDYCDYDTPYKQFDINNLKKNINH